MRVQPEAKEDACDLQGDMLLVAVGRRPHVSGLGLAAAGINHTAAGIEVNQNLQTSNPRVYAIGDCLGGPQFTHYAGWQAFTAVRNAFLPGSQAGFSEVLPSVTFTDPEVAQVGVTEAMARERYGAELKVVTRPVATEDRAQTDNVQHGFVKIIRQANGQIVGVTIVAPRAGELITTFAVAMKNKVSLAQIAHTMHPYPTYATGMQLLASGETMNDFQASRTGKIARWLVNR